MPRVTTAPAVDRVQPALPDAPLFPPPARPARVTISRTSPNDVGFREIYVLIDDEEVAELRFGGTVTREVDAGVHRLRAHNTLFRKTHELLIAPGDHVHLRAVNRPGWGTFELLGVLGVAPLFLTFEVMAVDTPGDA